MRDWMPRSRPSYPLSVSVDSVVETVGDYVSLVRGTTYRGDLVDRPGPALLGLGSIEPGGGFRADYKTYGGECPENLLLFPGDLYASLKGATKDGKMIGSVARVPPWVESGRLTQDTVALKFTEARRDDASYLYWVLRTPQYRSYCASRATGSAVVALSRQDFLSYPVPPATLERKVASALLDAIEKKIELNRRRSGTLDAIARTVFRAWLAGESSVEELSDVYRVADVVYGAPFKSALFNEDGVGRPLIRIRDLATHEPGTFTTEEHPRGYLVQPGDLVVGMDGEFRAHLWRGPEAWLNQRLCCFRPRPGIPRAFVHYSIEEPLAFFERSKTGTTVIHLGKRDIDEFRIVVPSDASMRQFASIADPIDERMVLLGEESRTLAALRDSLLSKLLSGELHSPIPVGESKS